MTDTTVVKLAKATVAVSSVAFIASLAALGGAMISNDNRVSDIQASRLEAALRACELRNDEHRAIRRFVRAARAANPSGASQTAPSVDAAFPIERDCTTYARVTVRLR